MGEGNAEARRLIRGAAPPQLDEDGVLVAIEADIIVELPLHPTSL